MIMIPEEEAKKRIAKRISKEFTASDEEVTINLGVGIPTLVVNYIDTNNVYIQTENGMLGVGPIACEGQMDINLINAGRQPVTETMGCCYIDSATAFGMIRGAHIDSTVIGAFEVDQEANIANWIIPNGKQLGVGGAMDLISGVKKVIVAMQHTNKNGKPKIVKKCSLPITGVGAADMIVTELAVFCFENGRLTLEEIAPEATIYIIRDLTEAEFEVSPLLEVMGI